MRNGLTQLWGLKGPKVGHLQAGVWDCWCYSSSPDSKSWEPGVPASEGRRWMFQLKQREPFCSAWGLAGSDDAHPHWCELSPSLSLLIWLIATALTDIPRDSVLPALRASLGPVRLAHNVTHHKWLLLKNLSLWQYRTRQSQMAMVGSSLWWLFI